MGKIKLIDKQQKFVEEYLIDLMQLKQRLEQGIVNKAITEIKRKEADGITLFFRVCKITLLIVLNHLKRFDCMV